MKPNPISKKCIYSSYNHCHEPIADRFYSYYKWGWHCDCGAYYFGYDTRKQAKDGYWYHSKSCQGVSG